MSRMSSVVHRVSYPLLNRLLPSISSTLFPRLRRGGTSSSALCSPPTHTSWTSSVLVSRLMHRKGFAGVYSRSPGCFAITTVFSHAQTVVLCGACASVLCQPTGGKARLTEGEQNHRLRRAMQLIPTCRRQGAPTDARTEIILISSLSAVRRHVASAPRYSYRHVLSCMHFTTEDCSRLFKKALFMVIEHKGEAGEHVRLFNVVVDDTCNV